VLVVLVIACFALCVPSLPALSLPSPVGRGHAASMGNTDGYFGLGSAKLGWVVGDAIVLLETSYFRERRATVSGGLEGRARGGLHRHIDSRRVGSFVFFSLPGVIGLHFHEFAVVISAGGHLVSFLAPTLNYMLASRFLTDRSCKNQLRDLALVEQRRVTLAGW
jgi:HAE1 family hydrophobic/amphiphilic exporter-1